jgi:hypothetical protein
MIINDDEIWNKVIELEGKELLTYVEKERNIIIRVDNKHKNSDQVYIADRETYPIREDIIAAYKLFIIQGRLNRKIDLQWLSRPDKMVSSIVFRIVGEISKNHSRIDCSKSEPELVHIRKFL